MQAGVVTSDPGPGWHPEGMSRQAAPQLVQTCLFVDEMAYA